MKEFTWIAWELTMVLRKKAHHGNFEIPTAEKKEVSEMGQDTPTSPPILFLQIIGRHYMLDTDVSANQVGFFLLQEQEYGEYLPVGYWSRIFSYEC